MRLPTISGMIDRRILVNFRIAPAIVASVLPAPFRPKLVNGFAIGGICLIRLKQIRPSFLRLPIGFRSENAAHRIAVEWDANGELHQGVYVPRRDTNSYPNVLCGGRLFPGIQHHAKFVVQESDNNFSIAMASDDRQASVEVIGSVATALPSASIFKSMEQASRFFELGSVGYSATCKPCQFDGMELRCERWKIEPLEIEKVSSSYFENEKLFARGTVEFDCALLMRGIQHQWHRKEKLLVG